MLLTLLSQLKKKDKTEKIIKNKDSNRENDSLKKEKKKRLPKKEKQKTSKKRTSKKNRFFKINKERKIQLFKGAFGSSQILVLIFVIFYFLINITVFLGSKTVYLNGHFEYYDEESSIFIPDCSKMTASYILQEKNIGDVFYYSYDFNTASWKIDNKKGLKLKIIDKNDYYIFTEIVNLDNYIVKNKTLDNFHIGLMANVRVPLKNSFNNYKIYFSLNDAVNILRDDFNIYSNKETED